MERAAAAGKVVLCRFTAEPNKPRALEVKEVDITSSDLPLFYAISHAKIAGLGSTIDNSIPSCQAAAMQSLVDQAEGEGSVPGSRFFWIDTLGVPLNKALGKQALCKVWDVFSRAKMTLVLDPEMPQRAFTTYEECLERIRVSVWKSRMWTPKEGFVSQNLVIRFLDRMISLDEALQRVDVRQTRAPPDVMIQKHDPNDAGPLDGTLSVPTRALTIMRCFEDGIAAWMMEANPAALLLSIKSDKMQLYKLSRLGYLAAPRLWYFAEADEYADSIRAWEILERVYAGLQDAASHRCRLRRVCRLWNSLGDKE